MNNHICSISNLFCGAYILIHILLRASVIHISIIIFLEILYLIVFHKNKEFKIKNIKLFTSNYVKKYIKIQEEAIACC